TDEYLDFKRRSDNYVLNIPMTLAFDLFDTFKNIVPELIVNGADGLLHQTRPIYASDMTQLVAYNATSLADTFEGFNGLEYAVNLEYLNLHNSSIQAVNNGLAAFEVGLRYGREAEGLLGLRHLRYVNLDFAPLVSYQSQVQVDNQSMPILVGASDAISTLN